VNNWVELILLCLIWYAVQDLAFKFFKSKKIFETSKKRTIIGWMIFLAIFFTYYFYSENDLIDDKKQYYVNLFPEENSQKNYRVPATIYFDESGGITLSSIDWSDGESTSFDYNNNNVNLRLGKKILMEDNEEEDWYVEFTNKVVDK
jgi:hypothetical protein